METSLVVLYFLLYICSFSEEIGKKLIRQKQKTPTNEPLFFQTVVCLLYGRPVRIELA